MLATSYGVLITVTLPKRARKITVDHREYRWLLSDARRPFQWLVIVQAVSGEGQRLRAGVPCVAAGAGLAPTVAPALIAKVVREGLSRGWSPERPGPDLRLQVAEPPGEPPPKTALLSGPVWELMLSTNGCHPGCGCEWDRFNITPESVRRWVTGAGPERARRAEEQLCALLSSPTFAHDVDRLSFQINRCLPGGDDGAWEWLREWHTLLAPMCDEPAPPEH